MAELIGGFLEVIFEVILKPIFEPIYKWMIK